MSPIFLKQESQGKERSCELPEATQQVYVRARAESKWFSGSSPGLGSRDLILFPSSVTAEICVNSEYSSFLDCSFVMSEMRF